jgi:hypothetical protein
MRNEFANHSVALNELCLPQTKKFFVDRFKSPRLSESVTFGFDTRYLVFDDGRVFRMQTDAYLAVEPLKDFYYHLRFWENGVNEHYALIYFHDQKYFIKAGRFFPGFGLHDADHKAYVRDRTRHGSNVYLDGISLGAEIHGVNVNAEIFNPNGRAVFGLHTFRAGSFGPVGYLRGLSIRISEKVDGTTGQFPDAKGIFGGLSYDRFTVLGEFDLTGRGNDSLIAYASLTSRLEYGLYIIADYNFFDGDRHSAGGVDEFVRLSVELYPMPFVQLRPSYIYYTRGALKDQDDFFVQFHVGY